MSFYPNSYSNYPQDMNSSMQFEQFQYNTENKPVGNTYQTPNYQNAYMDSFNSSINENFEDEPPLLEELGINFSHIKKKTLIVLNPFISTDKEVVEDTDLAGPLVFGLLFGATLLLAGKIHFNYIYGIGVLGCIAMYGLLTMMAATGVSVLCVISILGYCLLPMSLLSIISTLLTMKSLLGVVLTLFVVLWCSLSASKLFVTALNMEHQQILVAYPCSLVYGVFALLSVF